LRACWRRFFSASASVSKSRFRSPNEPLLGPAPPRWAGLLFLLGCESQNVWVPFVLVHSDVFLKQQFAVSSFLRASSPMRASISSREPRNAYFVFGHATSLYFSFGTLPSNVTHADRHESG
jgi:hypothetical protein